MNLLSKILKCCINESEEELQSRYKTEVVDCHPFNTPVPITYEEWKELEGNN